MSSPSSPSSPFRNLGDLLDPNCPIAENARAEARLEAVRIAEARKALDLRIAHRARWDAMSKEDKEDAMNDRNEDEVEG